MIRIKHTIKNISNQTENVLNFVRQTTLEIKETSIVECIKNVLFGITMHNMINIKIPSNDFKINADQSKLEIVFSNLINNAIESIGNNKGTIEIQIRKNQRNVFIDIKDSSSGIKQLHMKKIFESLYSEKTKFVN